MGFPLTENFRLPSVDAAEEDQARTQTTFDRIAAAVAAHASHSLRDMGAKLVTVQDFADYQGHNEEYALRAHWSHTVNRRAPAAGLYHLIRHRMGQHMTNDRAHRHGHKDADSAACLCCEDAPTETLDHKLRTCPAHAGARTTFLDGIAELVCPPDRAAAFTAALLADETDFKRLLLGGRLPAGVGAHLCPDLPDPRSLHGATFQPPGKADSLRLDYEWAVLAATFLRDVHKTRSQRREAAGAEDEREEGEEEEEEREESDEEDHEGYE